MFKFLVLILYFLSALCIHGQNFKKDQKRYPRVRKAISSKDDALKATLKAHDIERENLEIYIQAFKLERKIALYGKNKTDTAFQLLKEIDICALSGNLGPKRQQGDLQIPEGYYYINVFNPSSNFHLSLGLNYPNASDKILGVKKNLGGDIYIHGDCVTIGCLPLTNEIIEEVYLYCVEAKHNGQEQIPVTIYPAKLTSENCKYFHDAYGAQLGILGLWEDLKLGFDLFEKYKRIPKVTFLPNGRHKIK